MTPARAAARQLTIEIFRERLAQLKQAEAACPVCQWVQMTTAPVEGQLTDREMWHREPSARPCKIHHDMRKKLAGY